MARRRRFTRRTLARGNHWVGNANQQGITLTDGSPDVSDATALLRAVDIQPQGVTPMEPDAMTLMAIRGNLDVRVVSPGLSPDRAIGCRFTWGIYLTHDGALSGTPPDPENDDDLSTVDWLYLQSLRGQVVDEFTPVVNWSTDPHYDIHIKARRKLRADMALHMVVKGVATSTLGGSDLGVDAEWSYRLRFLIRV